IDREAKPQILQELKEALGISELIYLATCNRVEFFYAIEDKYPRGNILHRLIDFFLCDSSDINFFPNDFYHYSGKDAITHLFRTVSSLESLVVGETQITGQFKDAYEEAFGEGLAGQQLKKLANEALNVARKVKRETGLGEGSQSMASLASSELETYFKGAASLSFALVGAGTMTEKFAKYIIKTKMGNLIFVNRSLEKAQELADKYNGQALSLDEFKNNPPKIDSIISATAADEPVFDDNFLNNIEPQEKPILCIDLAIPRDFSEAFNFNKNVRLIDISSLKSKAQSNLRHKFIEASKANNIIKESVRKFLSDCLEVSIKPIFNSSYQESLQLARNAFNDLFKNRVKTLDKEDEEAVFNLVTKLIGHSAFQPARKLSKQLALHNTQFEMEEIPSYDKEII
ncbi:glutamyl-tRNA reductase, partial [Candidatus Zixiibacteriota bacterium]